MHLTPPVPDLLIDVDGLAHHGQHWRAEEFRVRCAQRRAGAVEITASTAQGLVVATRVLDDELAVAAADALREHLSAVETAVPGLARELRWHLEDDDWHRIDLAEHLEEIGEWFQYATGAKAWDPADTTWTY